MRNQPCYLTTGGGDRPDWLPTRWLRATRPVRRVHRALEGEATARFIAGATALALLIALAFTAVFIHLAATPHHRAIAELPDLPSLSSALRSVGSSAPAGRSGSAALSVAGAATGLSDDAAPPAAGASRSTTRFTATEAARLALKTIPGLVNITTKLRDGSREAGTGIVLRTSGLVLTAAHVITAAVTVCALDLGDGQDYSATVIGSDARHDVALIQLHGAVGLHVAHLADSEPAPLLVGDQVESVGNAYGRGEPTIGTGPVTALRRTISAPALPGHRMGGLIEAENSILPGQSGGPMLNKSGVVIGMNDAYELTAEGGAPTGRGYAIPISTALHIAHTLLVHHTKQAPQTLS